MQARCFVMLLFVSAALVVAGFYAYTHRHHIPTTGYASLDKWRASRVAIYTNDFGELNHYREDNQKLRATPDNSGRVVFMGDSIIEFWKLADTFAGKPYINRGIVGQSTSQMLVRFRQDVIELQPEAAVILASSNDISGTTGPMTEDDIHANYATFSDLARQNGIKLIFISMLPVHNYTPESQDFYSQRPKQRTEALNAWLKQFCAAQGHTYVDLNSLMLDEKGMLRSEYANDGLHPEPSAYAVMAKHLQPVIDEVLAQATTSNVKENHRVLGD